MRKNMYSLNESAKRLKNLRKEMHKTQDQVAVELGISVDTVRKNEQGVRGLSIDSALMYAEYYGTSIDYIIRGTNVKSGINDILANYPADKQCMAVSILKGILDNLK